MCILAAADLGEKSFTALQEVLRDADRYEARRRARKRLDMHPSSSQSKKKDKGKGILKYEPPKRRALRRRGGGVKIREPEEDDREEEVVVMDKRGRPLFIDPKGLPPVVCGLTAAPSTITDAGCIDGWEELGDKEIYVEKEGGGWTRFRVAEEWDQDLIEDGHEIPMSPCTSGELNPKDHCFLVVRKGTPPSS